MEDKFQIDITPQLESFAHQLEQEDRVIFSAGFGDGKTYFLNRFQEEYKDEYVFFTVYPVNYVISENEHILEYIKRGILTQLADDNGFYLDEIKPGKVLESVVNSIPLEGIMSVAAFVTGMPFLSGLSALVNGRIKELNADLNEAHISTDKYKDSLNYRGSIYENDAFTVFIAKSLDALRKLEKKKIVLIIEDLDRLEPGKIFNILNVFGSHLDRPFFNKTGESIKNKFGFDKIITVMDYSKVEKCFEYMYGNDQNFQGFLSKFMISKPYNYSITDLARKVVADKLFPLYDLDSDPGIVYSTLLILLKGRSIRELERIYNYDPKSDIKDTSRSIGSYVIYKDSPLLLRELYLLKFNLNLLPPDLNSTRKNQDDHNLFLHLYSPYVFLSEFPKCIVYKGDFYKLTLYGLHGEFITAKAEQTFTRVSPYYEINNNLSSIIDSIRTKLRQMCFGV